MFKLPYFLEGITNIFKPVLTDDTPVEEVKGCTNYRGKIEFNSEACIGCGICMRVCAGDAITKDVKVIEGGQEITMSFDLYSCTFCGLCKDFCPKKAIDLTDEVIMVATDKEQLKLSGTFIKKVPPKTAVKPKTTVQAPVANKEEDKIVNK